MLPKSDKEIFLSVITPVTALANNIDNLSSWLTRISNKPIEVILIHDKSDICTGPQLEKLLLEVNNPNVIYIEGEFGSPGLARNEGLKIASGEWVCFWDGDDIPMLDEIFLLLEKKFDDVSEELIN
jgi:glycosyltransferase involved in cell wall biosynthesis